MADSYDVIVIGGGPGGYVAAIRAAQFGLKTAVVEKDKPGGRCLNYACIPAKTMLHTAEVYDHALNGAELGVKVTKASIDWKALAERRDPGLGRALGRGQAALGQEQGHLDRGRGLADGLRRRRRRLRHPRGQVGRSSRPARSSCRSPGVEFSERIVDTWGAWSLSALPKRLAVVGAGASGTEIASAYVRYGTEVTLIEMLPQILPLEDKDMARVVERTFKRQGINDPHRHADLRRRVDTGKSVKFKVGDTEGEADYLAIAGGRAPDTEALNLAGAKVETEENGRIKVDEFQRTSNQKVFAIGDLVRGAALAHKAIRGRASSRSRRSPARRPTRSMST